MMESMTYYIFAVSVAGLALSFVVASIAFLVWTIREKELFLILLAAATVFALTAFLSSLALDAKKWPPFDDQHEESECLQLDRTSSGREET